MAFFIIGLMLKNAQVQGMTRVRVETYSMYVEAKNLKGQRSRWVFFSIKVWALSSVGRAEA
ncbi:MAG TPA: hypothetical protein DCR39_00755 [Nitrospiraceae bacterium]|nr:hypothetical protein [Nitrospiraceae bacterium]